MTADHFKKMLFICFLIYLLIRLNYTSGQHSVSRIRLHVDTETENIPKCGAAFIRKVDKYIIRGVVNSTDGTITGIFFQITKPLSLENKTMPCIISFIDNVPENNTPDCYCSPRANADNIFDFHYVLFLGLNDSETKFSAHMNMLPSDIIDSIQLPKVYEPNKIERKDQLYFDEKLVNTTNCIITSTSPKNIRYNIMSTPQVCGELLLVLNNDNISLEVNKTVLFPLEKILHKNNQEVNFTVIITGEPVELFSCLYIIEDKIERKDQLYFDEKLVNTSNCIINNTSPKYIRYNIVCNPQVCGELLLVLDNVNISLEVNKTVLFPHEKILHKNNQKVIFTVIITGEPVELFSCLYIIEEPANDNYNILISVLVSFLAVIIIIGIIIMMFICWRFKQKKQRKLRGPEKKRTVRMSGCKEEEESFLTDEKSASDANSSNANLPQTVTFQDEIIDNHGDLKNNLEEPMKNIVIVFPCLINGNNINSTLERLQDLWQSKPLNYKASCLVMIGYTQVNKDTIFWLNCFEKFLPYKVFETSIPVGEDIFGNIVTGVELLRLWYLKIGVHFNDSYSQFAQKMILFDIGTEDETLKRNQDDALKQILNQLNLREDAKTDNNYEAFESHTNVNRFDYHGKINGMVDSMACVGKEEKKKVKRVYDQRINIDLDRNVSKNIATADNAQRSRTAANCLQLKNPSLELYVISEEKIQKKTHVKALSNVSIKDTSHSIPIETNEENIGKYSKPKAAKYNSSTINQKYPQEISKHELETHTPSDTSDSIACIIYAEKAPVLPDVNKESSSQTILQEMSIGIQEKNVSKSSSSAMQNLEIKQKLVQTLLISVDDVNHFENKLVINSIGEIEQSDNIKRSAQSSSPKRQLKLNKETTKVEEPALLSNNASIRLQYKLNEENKVITVDENTAESSPKIQRQILEDAEGQENVDTFKDKEKGVIYSNNEPLRQTKFNHVHEHFSDS